MAMTVSASCAGARTILFDSLRIDAFQGAVPHVVLVLDERPSVLAKVLVDGYVRVLNDFNGQGNKVYHDEKDLFINLHPETPVPCGSSIYANMAADASRIAYSVLPFRASTFMQDMRKLQFFFRHCGAPKRPHPLKDEQWTEEVFYKKFSEIEQYLVPVVAQDSSESPATDWREQMLLTLRQGPRRELLSFILIQQHAFQNDLKKYRLRLSLFDMGMRVAEHCHLGSMSDAADALVQAGRYMDALEDDQVYSYARSCSLRPTVAEGIGKAIADTIDMCSWKRSDDRSLSPVLPAPAYITAQRNNDIWSLFHPEAVTWRGVVKAVESEARAAFEEVMARPVLGPGDPLRIIGKDPRHVLTYRGGMEDCLMNTGYYDSAYMPERNDVWHHRERFALSPDPVEWSSEKKGAGLEANREMGRMKKKEYLAMVKTTGQKSKRSSNAPAGDGSDDETMCVSQQKTAAGAGSCIGNSIGGTFPIGEVISESFDLSQLSGSCRVFAYPDMFKRVAMSQPEPFTMTIEKGIVLDVGEGAPEDFVDLLSLVRQVEGVCLVRELGIGLNPFVGVSHIVMDVTSFERQWGVHLSLGQRHPLFVKRARKYNADGTIAGGVKVEGPVLKRKEGKYHIDVFVDAAELSIGHLHVDFTKGLAVR